MLRRNQWGLQRLLTETRFRGDVITLEGFAIETVALFGDRDV